MNDNAARHDERNALTRYFNYIRAYPLLSAEEEAVLSRAALAGDRHSRERMITGNLRLVIRIARQYQRSGMAVDDLIEEGNLGLMHAIGKYDPSLGYRLSTYAVWWIRQYIERAIMNQSRVVRLPVHLAKRLNRCLRASRELRQCSGREPSARDIATEVGRSPDEVRELMCWQEAPSSLDHQEEGTSWQDALPAPDSYNPSRRNARDDMQQALLRHVGRLTAREREILLRRFGLGTGVEETLERIAADIGLTRERVRQIQIEALFKLREWLSSEGIEPGYLDES